MKSANRNKTSTRDLNDMVRLMRTTLQIIDLIYFQWRLLVILQCENTVFNSVRWGLGQGAFASQADLTPVLPLASTMSSAINRPTQWWHNDILMASLCVNLLMASICNYLYGDEERIWWSLTGFAAPPPRPKDVSPPLVFPFFFWQLGMHRYW